MTPFEALYGRPPPTHTAYVPGSSKIASLHETLSQRSQILKTLKANLVRACNRMVQHANSKSTEREFHIGD